MSSPIRNTLSTFSINKKEFFLLWVKHCAIAMVNRVIREHAALQEEDQKLPA